MSVRYIIQARFNSTRLPGKIGLKIGDRILLRHIVDRVMLAGARKSEIRLAIADENHDQWNSVLQALDIDFYRGDVHNVLKRYVDASADMSGTDLIVRLTGDNPFVDFKRLAESVRVCMQNPQIDYSYPSRLPLGMGYEIIRKSALNKQMEYELKPHHLEHVTTFMRENQDLFRIMPMEYFLHPPEIRMTIDYAEDLEQARKTYMYFQRRGIPDFCSDEVYNLYNADPGFFDLNRNMVQKSPRDYEKKTNETEIPRSSNHNQ